MCRLAHLADRGRNDARRSNSGSAYLRLAKEFLDAAATFPDGEQRDALLQMAQVWQRLADTHSDATASLHPLVEREQPAMQQQQQVQPRTTARQNRPPQLAACFVSNQVRDVAYWHNPDLARCPP